MDRRRPRYLLYDPSHVGLNVAKTPPQFSSRSPTVACPALRLQNYLGIISPNSLSESRPMKLAACCVELILPYATLQSSWVGFNR